MSHTMREKHYTAVARILRDCGTGAPKAELDRLERLAYMLADYFAGENPLFNRDKFLTGAGF